MRKYLLLALVALVVATYVIWDYTAARSLRAELLKIRAAGEPLTFQEIDDARPPVDPSQDAALAYAEALEISAVLTEEDKEAIYEVLSIYREVVQRDAPPDQATRKRTTELLAESQSALDLVDKATALPECRYDVDYPRDFIDIRNLLRLVALRTRDLATNDSGDAATASVVSALGLRRPLERYPIVIGFLVGTVVDEVSAELTAAVLSVAEPSPASLTKLEEELRAADRSGRLRDTLLAERVFVLLGLGHLLPEDVAPEQSQAAFYEQFDFEAMTEPGLQPRARGLMTSYLQDFRRFLEAAQRPWPGPLDSLRETDQAESEIGDMLRLATTRAASATALLRAARLAVLVKQYRAANDRLPQTLEALVPEFVDALPTDPFTGNAMRFVVQENSYVVYSVGRDRKDDGGNFKTEEQNEEGWNPMNQPMPFDVGLRVSF